MKTLKQILALVVLTLGFSLAANAQTFSNPNGCTTWSQIGYQFQLTSCSQFPMNQTVVLQSGLVNHFVLNPGQTVSIGTTSNRPWNYGCMSGWARLKSNPDLEPTYATPNDDTFCSVN